MDFVRRYFKAKSKGIILFLIFALVFVASAFLYGFPFQYVGTPIFLCLVIGVGYLIYDMFKLKHKYDLLDRIKNSMILEVSSIPVMFNGMDDLYVDVISNLVDDISSKETNYNASYNDMVDYFTTWAHQIKTPIASIKVNLQNEDSTFSRLVAAELNRIEQYVEMVLTYLRLDSDYTDYVFKESELDIIVKSCIKRYRQDFISKRLGINLGEIDIKVLTDEKWLSFVIEQILSNALKYTTTGSISMYLSSKDTLCIEDTGMGIAPNDLPRVWDKGYTGINGRINKSASGLGLYLCGQICKRLNIKISMESEVNKGTKVFLKFDDEKKIHE